MSNGMTRDSNSFEDQQPHLQAEHKQLQEQEHKIENEIRINTELENEDICRALAQQLVDIRKKKAPAFAASNRIDAIVHQHRAKSARNAGTNSTTANASNATNRATNDTQGLHTDYNPLKDMTIDSNDEDDYSYVIVGSKFNKRAPPTITSYENMNSVKEAKSWNDGNRLRTGDTTITRNGSSTATSSSPTNEFH